ncbi:type IV toxin-antitoxin system AbiEi family antitoxin domain-containing protein [Mycolicibacterium sp.]|uniref:type IV toxin-antitoxin system AbiEi family antitoxin domain-containing protein n=1 Tax=Mycolicibacterium sp. TaxID=2320850 RepID=UPI001A216B46|nr:type IV toxin-antitoxin system AbiEi family antitoxin domain-containing protein [Mycolicibacterium sp.]MBJ7336834.1 type IV toxin-antitoxin system AbiEi family antitoxin domain-containing protein [Mycolicibacterium sp.]
MYIHELITGAGGLATADQLQAVMSRKMMRTHLRSGEIVRVCHGVYALAQPDVAGMLAALDLMVGRPLVACMGTAARLYGFDTEGERRVHVLDPGVRMRPTAGVMVHQRAGAPLRRVEGRLATAPAWTAVEVARTLRRPRALAMLDAALRMGACAAVELEGALREQKGRRGIVQVRELLPYADGRAESPMESEARLVFIDYGLPIPELQYEIVDHCGDLWRVDFAWLDAKVVAEYDSMEWHANPQAWKHDRIKVERLKDCGWTTVPMVLDDVRCEPYELTSRISRLVT